MEKDYKGGEVIKGKIAYINEYEVGEAPDQTEEKTRRYGSCEVAKELEEKFRDALYKLVYVDQEFPYFEMGDTDEVYNALQRGNEYMSYLMSHGAYKPKRRLHDGYSAAPTTILSKAIEHVEQMGNYKVMVAVVDLDKSKLKEDRLYTFTDIESKKLREVIYKEMENEL